MSTLWKIVTLSVAIFIAMAIVFLQHTKGSCRAISGNPGFGQEFGACSNRSDLLHF